MLGGDTGRPLDQRLDPGKQREICFNSNLTGLKANNCLPAFWSFLRVNGDRWARLDMHNKCEYGIRPEMGSASQKRLVIEFYLYG